MGRQRLDADERRRFGGAERSLESFHGDARGQVVLLGGTVIGAQFSDTWTWGGSRWSLAADAGSGPSPRYSAALTGPIP